MNFPGAPAVSTAVTVDVVPIVDGAAVEFGVVEFVCGSVFVSVSRGCCSTDPSPVFKAITPETSSTPTPAVAAATRVTGVGARGDP